MQIGSRAAIKRPVGSERGRAAKSCVENVRGGKERGLSRDGVVPVDVGPAVAIEKQLSGARLAKCEQPHGRTKNTEKPSHSAQYKRRPKTESKRCGTRRKGGCK